MTYAYGSTPTQHNHRQWIPRRDGVLSEESFKASSFSSRLCLTKNALLPASNRVTISKWHFFNIKEKFIKKSDQRNVNLKLIRNDREGYYILKGKIHQKGVAILNIYVPNLRAPKLIKETLLQLK